MLNNLPFKVLTPPKHRYDGEQYEGVWKELNDPSQFPINKKRITKINTNRKKRGKVPLPTVLFSCVYLLAFLAPGLAAGYASNLFTGAGQLAAITLRETLF